VCGSKNCENSFNEKLCYRRRTAGRAVCRNLVICCTTVGTSCIPQIEIMKLDGYIWPACNKQPRCVGRRRCHQQALLSTSSVDNAIDLPWRNFPEFGTSSRGKALVLEIREFPYKHEVGKIEGNPCTKNHPSRSFVSIELRLVMDAGLWLVPR